MQNELHKRIEASAKVEKWSEVSLGNNPIYIYGAGNVAEAVYRKCKEKGFLIKAFFVDDDYFQIKKFMGLKVLKKSEVLRDHLNISVIMGIGNYYKGVELENEYKEIKMYYIPGVFDFQSAEYLSSDNYFYRHQIELENIFSYLADDFSKDCMVAQWDFVINGNLKLFFKSQERNRGYFRNSVIGEDSFRVVVDVGAYTGDTIKELMEVCHDEIDKVYAFEGDSKAFSELYRYVESNELYEAVELYHVFLSDKAGKAGVIDDSLNIQTTRLTSITDKKSTCLTNVESLDNLLSNRCHKIGYIKINIGDCLKVLQGSVKVITEDRPIVGIMISSAMHIVGIANFFICRFPDYKLYLRYLAAMPERLALFAIPNGKK